MTTYKLGTPASLKRLLAGSLPGHGGQPVVRVTPRDRCERRSAAYDADHYEVSAFYTSSSADALASLEEALKAVPGVYLTTQVHALAGSACPRVSTFTNPAWPAPLGTARRDRNELRPQVIALMKDDVVPLAAPATASLYRCAECGHGQDLGAWAIAVIHGPLGADGELAAIGWDEQLDLHEDSIQCAKHPGARIEKRVSNWWCLWRNCPRCDGAGRSRDRGWDCPEEGFRPADSGPGGPLAHSGWWPSDEPVPASSSSLDRLGHQFTPGVRAHCRHCEAIVGAVIAKNPCPGDQHRCPAIVPEGDGDTASQVWRRDEWLCSEPGEMNGNFTEWRCRRGHVITRGGHVPAGQQHKDACHVPGLGCPWESLAG